MANSETPFESFAPFTPEAPPSAGEPAPKTKRKGGRPKKVQAEPASPPKAGRKNPPKAGRQAHLTVSAAITAFAGLSGPEADLVGRMVIALQGAPKKSRGRIIAALGKAFA